MKLGEPKELRTRTENCKNSLFILKSNDKLTIGQYPRQLDEV